MTKQLATNRRTDWLHLLNTRQTFRGTVERFGHKHRQGSQIKRGATICLTNVHLKYSNKVIDHVWLDFTPNLAVFGELLKPKTVLEFNALITTYIKTDSEHFDLKLTHLTEIKVISHPRLTKSDLVNSNLVSYAIKTHTNTKRGAYLGKDPQGKLGKIYVGQTFANKLAKYLTWKNLK